MTELFAAVCSITATQRRRFFWAAWWTASPSREPFQKPDASSGGARTREEAKQAAEKAAGRMLQEIEPRWARAWMRVNLGQPPWVEREPRPVGARRPGEATASVWATLGLTPAATTAEIKRAYRQKALELHPDRGGEAQAFRALHQAYRSALGRRAKADDRPRRRR